MMNLYKKCVNKFGWNLRELDDTDFETLMEFIWFEDLPDPNTRVIDGKTYKRAETVPSWL